jgi:phosphoribosylglycinamide formyltransferase-1
MSRYKFLMRREYISGILAFLQTVAYASYNKVGRNVMQRTRCRVAVLASGTGTNFKAIAATCQNEDFPADVVCLITDNPDAGALAIARNYGIPHHIIEAGKKRGRLPAEAEEKIVEICRNHEVELVALAGFMRILRGVLLDAYEGRILNIHPSLLPSFKGLHAQKQAFDYGVKIAGCSVHFVDRSVDGGPIIIQAAVPVEENDTADTLSARILEQEHRIYARAIQLFALKRLRIDGRRVIIMDRA